MSAQSDHISRTWVVQQHNQIKGCVSIFSSQVDISPLTQQVLDNVFIAGRRERETNRKRRKGLMIMSAYILYVHYIIFSSDFIDSI